MRLTLPDAAASVLGSAGIKFAERVRARTNGQIKIEVYPSGQLATQQETIDGMVSGVIDFAILSSVFLVPLLPQFQVLDMPFLFKDLRSAYSVMDGSIGRELFGQLEPKGIVGLGWGVSGFRELETVSKVVTAPEDMKGLRIRIVGGAVYVATYQSLGAIPVTIDTSEMLVGLQQHTIDGLDIALSSFTSQKLYSAVRHVAMLNHIFSIAPLFGSKRRIEALPAPLQRAVREEGGNVVGYWRSLYAERTVSDTETLKKSGVAFSETNQFVAFRKTVQPVYAGVQSRIGGDLVERISKAAGTA